MKKIALLSLFFIAIAMVFLVRAFVNRPNSPVSVTPTKPRPAASQTTTALPTSTETLAQTAMPTTAVSQDGLLPNFDHIVLIVLENEYLQNVVGSAVMPNFNSLAKSNVLLSNYSAVTHPSLPNYLVLISGSTQDITTDCTDCSVDAPNLADEIESSGRTWKAYFEDMPSPCFTGSRKPYEKYFNPFIYFNSIQKNSSRCTKSVVPLTQLDTDLKAHQLPNFMYIAPNVCHSGHDCSASVADNWLGGMVSKLQKSGELGSNSLLIITFDEGLQLPQTIKTHGEVATILISPSAQAGMVDSTAYTHYNLLKTILAAWHLPDLGATQIPAVNAIVAPWVDQMGLFTPQEMTATP